jgi:hypothetical protein
VTNRGATFVGEIYLICYSCEYFESVLSVVNVLWELLKWYVSIEEV